MSHRFVYVTRWDGRRVPYCVTHKQRLSLRARGALGRECDRLYNENGGRAMQQPRRHT